MENSAVHNSQADVESRNSTLTHLLKRAETLIADIHEALATGEAESSKSSLSSATPALRMKSEFPSRRSNKAPSAIISALLDGPAGGLSTRELERLLGVPPYHHKPSSVNTAVYRLRDRGAIIKDGRTWKLP